MNIIARALPKLVLALAVATGTAGALAASAQPARAGVLVSVGVGAYAPGYHWFGWRDRYGWHRRWVPIGWAPPAYAPYPAFAYRAYPAPVVYARPVYWHRDWIGRRYWR